MNDELAMTAKRIVALGHVRDGLVTYDSSSGHWRVSNKVQTGWWGRTLSALRRNDYITIHIRDNPLYTVDLTDKGKEALA
jgi:hypothetical protein